MNRKPYFIDDDIWFKGKKQPPRKVYCHELEMHGGKAKFYDEDGNGYSLPDDRIMWEKGDESE